MSQKRAAQKEARIVAIGVGNSGSNLIKYMMNDKPSSLELLISNTHTYESLHETIEGADIVFVVAGFGGTTGIAHSIFVARMAKAAGALTIGVVSTPFPFECQSRFNLAEDGIGMLKTVADSVVVIPYSKFLPDIDIKFDSKACYRKVDSVFARVINAIAGVIIPGSEYDINLDIIDLQTIMIHRGIAIVGIGEYQGENAAYKAMKSAMKFATVDGLSMKNASGILVHFNMHSEFHFMELSSAMEVVHKSIDESAEVIFGTTTDDSFPLDFIRVTIIATGIEKIPMKAANNVY